MQQKVLPDILFEDTHIIVCRKPAGVPTQSSSPGISDMEHILKNYIYRSSRQSTTPGKPPYLAVIHRLDQPVEGLLVFAKTPFAAKELNRQLTSGGFGKYYLALLTGSPMKPSGTLEDYLTKDIKSNTSLICTPNTKGAKKAVLHYHTLPAKKSPFPDTVWAEIQLETGRHHQIRVQMAHLGCPLWGDTKYNPTPQRGNVWSQLQLYACKLSFLHPKTKKAMTFELNAAADSI